MMLPKIPSILILSSMFATISCKDINEGLSKDAKERPASNVSAEFKILEKADGQPIGIEAGTSYVAPLSIQSNDVVKDDNQDELANQIAHANETPDPTRASRTLILY